MSSDTLRVHDPAPFFRGTLPESAPGSRIPAAASGKLPTDTVAAARVPAGVHLALVGTATAVDIAVLGGERTSVPAPTVAEVLLARCGTATTKVSVPVSGGVVRLPLPERDPDEIVRIHLPEAVETEVEALLPVDGSIVPAPRGPRWVVYGDSIVQGWSVTEPGLAWPSLVANELGLDLVNLGFAGAARGELPAADVVGRSEATAVALAWGTNAWSSVPTDSWAVAETMRLFLRAVRQGSPMTPIVVVSPIVRPAAEDTPNRFDTTHRALRGALEDAVHAYVDSTGDSRVTLVPGGELVSPEHLADGIHPDDTGHRIIADALAPAVAASIPAAATI
ncbi:lysophospholipase L1-like esterase [Prauserella sediminis]|uniref:Lysophospholipase L1-like esterase n=1 Tax=Prauserella sediminis TaxID=577680 RepID=A0A839XP02_9PSEU|nr:SGNH/GDSL hydrolase family protein [Prauserella sediminis]MBB3665572.1 lysophospholipase L1-like esterase [Prauserella sediminis]